MTEINLTLGHIVRHTPPGAGAQGRDAAIIDIAQDLLLRDLYEKGALAPLAFKGGTSLRKLYAGNAGRFSLDLDFSGTTIGSVPRYCACPKPGSDPVLFDLKLKGRGGRLLVVRSRPGHDSYQIFSS